MPVDAFRMVTPIAASALALFASEAVKQPSQGGGEVLIVEDEHPKDVQRALSARCGSDRYELAVAVGRTPVVASVLRVQVNGRSRVADLRSALGSLPRDAVAIVDIDIDRCEGGRAQFQFDILRPGKPPNVHHYRVGIGANGRFEMLGKR